MSSPLSGVISELRACGMMSIADDIEKLIVDLERARRTGRKDTNHLRLVNTSPSTSR